MDENKQSPLTLDFGASAGRIAALPNVVFRANRTAFMDLLNITGCTAGIWGIELPHVPPDAQAPKGYYEFRFAEWETPENQSFAIEQGWGMVQLDTFTMVLDSRTQEHVIEKINRQVDWAEDSHISLDRVPDWICELGWAYIPLKSSELGHALVVVSPVHRGWLIELIHRLNSRGEKYATLVLRGESDVVWSGPAVL